MPFNDLERIKNNQELYGEISTDDEATILADNSLSTEEKNVAVLSPDTYKQKKKQYSVEDEMAKYPALFSNLKIPSMYAMTAAYKDELKKYEDEFYAESKKQGALANAWNSFWYSRKAMEISALDADRMDAIRDNDEAKLAEIDNKIKVAREELSQMEAPTDENSFGSVAGAFGASFIRLLPELIASGVITTGLASLAGISGGTSLAGAAVSGGRFVNALSKIRGGYNAVRAAKAMKYANIANELAGIGIIYNDTTNVERGAAYRELSEQHPEMSEEEKQEKAWLIGRVNGGIEAATAGAFGLAARGFATVARPAQRALSRKLLTNETAATALKNATYDAIDTGILDAAKATDSRFISKLAGNLKAVLENPKVALGKEVIDYSMEGYTEIFQDIINKTVAEWDESKQGDLTAGSAISEAQSKINEGIIELWNSVVNDGTLSDETRQMFRKYGSVTGVAALFGRTGHYVGEAFNRIGRNKVSNPATQLEAANTTISKLDRVLEQKKNSALYGKSPEAANEFYNNVAKSGNLPKTISIDENKLKQLIEESKSDPVIQAQIARANLGEKLKTAEAGMVEMEFQEFNQAFLDPNNDTLYQKIKNDITENPAMMTKNESIAWLKGILENDENIVEAQKNKNSLYNRVYEISKKNGAEDELATAQAVFAQNAFSAIGRFGLSPKDAEAVAQEIGLRFEAEQRPEGILSRLKKRVKEAFTGKSGFVTDQSKAYARMIFEDELAALNKKKQAKLKEGKDVVQEEIRIKELEAILGDEGEIKTTEAQEDFIRAIEAKDIDTLADIISKNRQAKKFFESLEGVKLPSTKSGIAETLGNWARIDVAGEIGSYLKKYEQEYSKETIKIGKENRTIYNSRREKIALTEASLRNFYNWFRNSQIVNDKGEPLVLYHGSPTKGIKEMKQQLIFASEGEDVAASYSGDKGEIYPVYISANNVIRIDAEGKPFSQIYGNKKTDEVVEELRAEHPDIDGVIFENILDYGPRLSKIKKDYKPKTEVVIWDSSKIKRIDNSGSWGIETNNMLLQDISGIAGSTTFTPTETILRLSKISNPTTFIHEVGHIFIKQLLDMYNKGQLSPVWQKKAEDFIEFCGFEKDERGVIMAGEKYVAAQEKFADAMMTYFWEGKAPKPYLKAMFDAIAEWFADFYNMMKMSPLGLTPKVREAFDAIFTPYEEQKVVQAEKKLGFLPKPDGMSDAQYQQYIAEKRALTSYSATEEIRAAAKVAKLKTEKAYQEEYEASLNEAYQDLGKLPLYQMIEDIQVNKILAGTLNLPKGMALRKEFVSEEKGAAVQQVLDKYKDIKKTKADPNHILTEEELVFILNETPSRSAAAQYIAEKHMNEWLRENYPTTENLNAEFAEKNERAVRLATMEYMMLAGIDMKNFSLEYNSILAAGEELVQTMPMNKAVNVERWLEMENKILQKYEYAKTDKERAQLKRLQAVISFYAMRSKDIRTDYHKFSKKVRKYRKDPDSSGLRQMTGATWDLLKTILYNYNFTQSKPRSKETLLEKMTNLQMALLNEGFTSADVLDNYKYSLPQDKIDHKIEYGEFSKMTEIFSLVEGMGYAQKQVVVNGKRINIENTADDLIDYMQRENIKPVNERSAIGKGLDNWMIPEALLKEILPQKVYLDYIAPHMKGIAERDNQIRTWQNRQAELLKLYGGDYTEKVEIGGRAYTILDLLVIMLNSGNNHNFNCMVKTLQKKFGDLNYSAEDMMAALNAAPKELRAITRGIWQIFEENKEAFQEVQNQIDGKVIKFVNPDAYTFDDGEVMEGGYYPAGTVAQIKDFADTQSAFRVDGVYASQSFQKDRNAGVHGDLDLTLNSLTAWNYKMASVLHVAVPYNNLGKLLRNERVAIALGEYRVRWLNEWMKMSTAPLKVSPFLAAVDGLASVKILGWAPARAFTQMSGIFPAMQQIGTKWVMKAISQMGNPVHAIKKVSTLSSYMQARYANPEEHLNLLLQSRQMFGVNVKQKLKKGFEYYTDVAMFSVIYGDAIASYTTWTAEFEKQKAAGLSDQEASALADSQVRLLQGDMSAGSRPKGMQGNMRFFTKFASYFIGISSLLRAKAARGTAWDIIAREAGLLTSVCLFGAAWESLWKTMTKWLWAEATDDDDQKKKWAKKGINSPEDLFLSLAAENVASTFGSATVPMYGIGNAAMTALTTGNLYDAKNLQLDWMYNFLGVAQVANSFFVSDDEKAVKVRKKGLKNILSSAMTDSAANKVADILIGE